MAQLDNFPVRPRVKGPNLGRRKLRSELGQQSEGSRLAYSGKGFKNFGGLLKGT